MDRHERQRRVRLRQRDLHAVHHDERLAQQRRECVAQSISLGRIWAGTNNGLAMRAEAGYWLTFTTSTSPIAGNIVQALARDSTDRLWIGTASGVSVYDPTAWQHRVDQLHHCEWLARQSGDGSDR